MKSRRYAFIEALHHYGLRLQKSPDERYDVPLSTLKSSSKAGSPASEIAK